jgi:hypothetical protein
MTHHIDTLKFYIKAGGTIMSKFKSLSPSGLPKEFDAEVFSEKPIISVDEREACIEIHYIFPGFTVGDTAQQIDEQTMPFKEIGISGAGFMSESGKPLMPSFGRFIQIPPGSDYKVAVKKSTPVTFDEILVAPAQEQATDQAGMDAEFEFDPQAYKADVPYPAEMVVVSEPQNLDDYRVLLIQVRPLQYNPAKRQLVGYSNIDVTIKLDLKPLDREVLGEFPLTEPSVNREGFGNLVLNPRRGILERIPLPSIPGPIVIKPRGPEFLIIHDNQLKTAADKLADWKNRRGLVTEVVSIDRVGNTVEKIKTYIRNRRRFMLSGLRYVCLLGDVTAIASEEHGGATTDHYYFTPRDPANDGDCVLPWISGGRIPVNSLEEAQTVIDQIVNYERTPPADPGYYRRMTLAAFFQDDSPQDGRADRAYMKTMESIRAHMVALGFDVDRVYVSNNPSPQHYKDGTTVPVEVRNAIMDGGDATAALITETSQGHLLIGHRDHGSENGWAHPAFRKEHLSSISTHVPSIFHSINCLTGRFDYNPSDCFAEAILEMRGGAPSLVAATELSGTWRNDSLMKGLFDAIWPGVISTFPGTTASYAIKHNRLGDILNYAKSYLLVAHGANGGVRQHFEIYHVIGDPTLQLWASEPALIRLNASIRKNRLNVWVNPVPVEGVMTIWYHGKKVKRTVLTSTHMSFPVGDLQLTPVRVPFLRRSLDVCVSAPGYRYTQIRVKL